MEGRRVILSSSEWPIMMRLLQPRALGRRGGRDAEKLAAVLSLYVAVGRGKIPDLDNGCGDALNARPPSIWPTDRGSQLRRLRISRRKQAC